MVRYDAVEAYGNPIIVDDHDGRIAKFEEVTDVAHKHGSLIVAQLSHPGRQGNRYLNPNPISASDVHLAIKWAGNEFAPPRPMTIPEIKEMVKSWGESAYLCWKSGFDGVQGTALDASHPRERPLQLKYLQQFIVPTAISWPNSSPSPPTNEQTNTAAPP